MKRKNSASDYFYGYILVKLENANPEIIINKCLQNGISLYNIERASYTTVVFKMRKSQYGLLKKAIRKTGTRAKILKKYGIYFTWNRMNRRKFFVAGTFVFLLAILSLSSFIWKIDITGNKRLENKKILAELKSAGFGTGTFKYNLDLRKIEEMVLKKNDNISIIKINMDGTKAVVDIVERTMPSEIIDADQPVNIVSTKTGVISKVLAYQGQEAVKVGDYVKPNQLLISGVTTDVDNNLIKSIHAMGIVLAKTWYETVAEVNLKYKMTVRTGKFKTQVFYSVAGKSIKVKNSNINFKKYDKIKSVDKIKLFKFQLPITRITETYYEKTDQYKILTAKEAEKIATGLAEKNAKRILPTDSRILNKKAGKTVKKDKVEIRLLYTVEENIGTEIIIKQSGGIN